VRTFGVTEQTQAIGLHATNHSQIRKKMLAVKTKVKAALGGLRYSGLRVLCGDAFWDALIDDKGSGISHHTHAATTCRGSANARTGVGPLVTAVSGTHSRDCRRNALRGTIMALPNGIV